MKDVLWDTGLRAQDLVNGFPIFLGANKRTVPVHSYIIFNTDGCNVQQYTGTKSNYDHKVDPDELVNWRINDKGWVMNFIPNLLKMVAGFGWTTRWTNKDSSVLRVDSKEKRTSMTTMCIQTNIQGQLLEVSVLFRLYNLSQLVLILTLSAILPQLSHQYLQAALLYMESRRSISK